MPSVVAEVGSTANNYQVLAKLATGGMAEIFLARGASAGNVERYVVLKRILRERASDASFVQMFLEEARLAAQLNHPNVAQVYDIGKLGDSFFFTMEYVHGETVRALLHRARSLRREIPIGNILTVVANTAAGLHHAHERIGINGQPLGIVHRDISPSNLMISYEGSVKVVDFGVAKAENRAQETRSGTVKGKISYLSPEQCRGAPVDRRSDLFSLGIVFWEMLTTERLYRRESDFANMAAIVTEPPPPPSTRRPGLPPEIDAICVRMLSKTVEERFQNADELIETLEAAAARASAQMSASALSRFMRELFGQRPEPWVEMEQRDTAEGVTVTSEPIPPELIARLDPIDMHLARVRDLSGREIVSQSESHSLSVPPAAPMSQMMTAAMPASPDHLAAQRASANDMLAAVPQRPSSPGSHVPGVPAHLHQHSGSQPAYPVVQRTWLAQPPEVQHPPAAHLQPRGSKRLFVVIGVALALGIIIAIAVTRGDNDAMKATPDAAVAVVTATPDAAVIATPDAAVIATADAAVIAPPDAQVAATSIDAAVADAAVATPPDAAPRASRADTIQRAFDEKRFSDAVAACSDGVPGDRAIACTLAACELGETTKARTWLAKVSRESRANVAAVCKRNGIGLVPRRPRSDAGVVDCLANPMACQH